jgi:two-component system sensor histidine kinase PilS (NtrC family)
MKDTQESVESKESLSNRIQWFLFLRVIFGTFLLGSAILVQFKEGQSYLSPSLLYFYLSIATIYLLSFVYVFLLQWIKNLRFFTHLILSLDHILVTFIIFITGGILSVLSFLYPLLIITASILLYRRGGFLSASLSSILYGGLLDLEFYGKIHPLYPLSSGGTLFAPEGNYVLYTIFVNTSAFFLIAFLSSYLAEGAKKTSRELKEKQTSLDELKNLNENIIQSMTSGLLTLDRGGKIVSLNRAAEEIIGLTHKDIYLEKIEEIFPQLREYAKSPGGLTSGNSSPYRNEMSFKRKDGREIHLGFSISSLKNFQEDKIGKLIIFQDISRDVEMEKHLKQVERIAAVGELGARMAHEIKNPLASMCGSIQMLKEEINLKDPMSQRLMEIILREASRLDLLITNFLLFARPTFSEEKVVNLNHIIDDTLEIFAHGKGKDKIKVIRSLPEDIWLKADPEKIKQVFWNLFLNAKQAMSGGGELRIESKRQETKGKKLTDSGQRTNNLVEIKVSDTGSGISPENQNKIFDPFFTTRKKGTGLGLSVVKQIVEDYQGKIRVESIEGKGTTFFIYLSATPSPSGS